jgi:hypothetical protein
MYQWRINGEIIESVSAVMKMAIMWQYQSYGNNGEANIQAMAKIM